MISLKDGQKIGTIKMQELEALIKTAQTTIITLQVPLKNHFNISFA